MNKIDSVILSNNTFSANNFSILQKFPKMYNNDPLNATGFYCKLQKHIY